MGQVRRAHWDRVYAQRGATAVSWYQDNPARSRDLIVASGVIRSAPIIDVGGGASRLVDVLLADGYEDVTVLDVSGAALELARQRLGDRAAAVTFIEGDVTEFHPMQRFAVWHDRAVFHFLTTVDDRKRYVAALRRGLVAGGHVVIATFGPGGPDRCSGLEVVRYSPESLTLELGVGFALEQSEEEVHTTPTGVEQQFIYCRFRLRS